MKGLILGEFEELVMLMCLVLKEEAYGINIVEEIKSRMNRNVLLSAVHVTLYRLEDKGLVTSHMGGVTAARGGRRKRIFELTSSGFEMLKDSREKRISIWNLIPDFKIS